MLRKQDFDTTWRARNALVTMAYDRVWFPSASANWSTGSQRPGWRDLRHRHPRNLERSGGSPLRPTHTKRLGQPTLFKRQTPTVASMREPFARQRRWPVRGGDVARIDRANKGHWGCFAGRAEEVRPEHCFSRESDALPLDLDLNAAGWSLVSIQGARRHGWLGSTTVDPLAVERWGANATAEEGATYVAQVV
jgi:hypothetical protein